MNITTCTAKHYNLRNIASYLDFHNLTVLLKNNPNEKRRQERKEITFQQFFEEYIERYSKPYKKNWKEDQSHFQRHLLTWKDRKLSSITKQDVQKLHHEIGMNKGIYTANRLLALLSTVFNKAIEYGLWEKTNPASGIKKFREKSRDRFLQSDELPKFFSALLAEPNADIRDYVLLSLLTGARRTNVLSMLWSNVNLDRAEWYIPETKNGESQTVALSREALEVLQQRKINAGNNYVFPSHSKEGYLIDPKSGWRRILKRAGIENIRQHDLRRTLGSWQAKTGASLSIIGKSLNHKSPTTTAIYARLDLDPVRESIEKATKAMLPAAQLIKHDQ